MGRDLAEITSDTYTVRFCTCISNGKYHRDEMHEMHEMHRAAHGETEDRPMRANGFIPFPFRKCRDQRSRDRPSSTIIEHYDDYNYSPGKKTN